MTTKPKASEEMTEFEHDLLESIRQAHAGEYARIHTPDEIKARVEAKKRGRPLGSTKPSTKSPATLRIDTDALELWRASGKGWQTRAAALLAKHAPKH